MAISHLKKRAALSVQLLVDYVIKKYGSEVGIDIYITWKCLVIVLPLMTPGSFYEKYLKVRERNWC